MDKLHKGKNSPLNTVKAALKSASPDWEEVQKEAKVFATYGASLPKNDPPKRQEGSRSKSLPRPMRRLPRPRRGGRERRLEGTSAAFKKISSSCIACHKSHRPN